MKAILVTEFGGPDKLTFQDIPSPIPNDDQVLIDVHYAAINFPDTLIIQGKYQFQPPMPFSPGGEVSGIIQEVGKDVTHVKKGDRVISGCGWGGYAEQVVSFGSNTYKLPDDVPLREGASLLQTFATTYHALVDRGQAKVGETLLVLGAAGGTGTSAIQIGKALNLKIIACASTSTKRDYCLSQGADYVLDTNNSEFRDRIKELTKGKGVDIIYDPVGGSISELAFRSIAFGGRHLVVGFAQGEIPKLPWNLPLLKSASIVGVFWGGFFRMCPEQNAKNIAELISWMQSGLINPAIYKEFNLAEAPKALEIILSKEVMGKVILNVLRTA